MPVFKPANKASPHVTLASFGILGMALFPIQEPAWCSGLTCSAPVSDGPSSARRLFYRKDRPVDVSCDFSSCVWDVLSDSVPLSLTLSYHCLTLLQLSQ